MWARSKGHDDEVTLESGADRTFSVGSGPNGVRCFVWLEDPIHAELKWELNTRTGPFIQGMSWDWPKESIWNHLGFWYFNEYYQFQEYARRVFMVACPYWLPALALLVLPVLRARSWRRDRLRMRRGLCVRCAYDLRATPERCPECGAVPRSSTA
jgi:hypothetical protein